MMTSSDVRRPRIWTRRCLVAAAIVASAASGVVLAPATGHADSNGCTVSSGHTSKVRQTANGPAPFDGKVWTKQPPGCLDFNLIHVSARDGYRGMLKLKNDNRWEFCGKGFVTAPSVPKVLCSNVSTGTQMVVVTRSGTQRTVTMKY